MYVDTVSGEKWQLFFLKQVEFNIKNKSYMKCDFLLIKKNIISMKGP